MNCCCLRRQCWRPPNQPATASARDAPEKNGLALSGSGGGQRDAASISKNPPKRRCQSACFALTATTTMASHSRPRNQLDHKSHLCRSSSATSSLWPIALCSERKRVNVASKLASARREEQEQDFNSATEQPPLAAGAQKQIIVHFSLHSERILSVRRSLCSLLHTGELAADPLGAAERLRRLPAHSATPPPIAVQSIGLRRI